MLATTLASPPHFWTDRHIDVEYPFQALHPGHGSVVLCGCFVFVFLAGSSLTSFGRRHINPVFAIGCVHPVELSQVHSGLRHQCRQLGNEVQTALTDIIGSFDAQNIYDPFAGSGTTGFACIELGKHCTLTETNHSLAERLRQEFSFFS